MDGVGGLEEVGGVEGALNPLLLSHVFKFHIQLKELVWENGGNGKCPGAIHCVSPLNPSWPPPILFAHWQVVLLSLCVRVCSLNGWRGRKQRQIYPFTGIA